MEEDRMGLSYIKRFVPHPGKALLAGNSVGTDKMFLEANMPSVIEHLHYRLVDVSSIKGAGKALVSLGLCRGARQARGHRALADIPGIHSGLEYYCVVSSSRRSPCPTDRARASPRGTFR